MRKIILSFFSALAILLVMANSAVAQTQGNVAVASATLNWGETQLDNRAETLALFLQKQNSPLVSYAEDFIVAADTYELDWKLVPAITGVESSFGKRIPFRSYNAYGWNNGDWRFESWEDSIWHVSKVLKSKYVDRGATNVWSIGRIYAASPTWSARVNHFMAKIEKTTPPVLDL